MKALGRLREKVSREERNKICRKIHYGQLYQFFLHFCQLLVSFLVNARKLSTCERAEFVKFFQFGPFKFPIDALQSLLSGVAPNIVRKRKCALERGHLRGVNLPGWYHCFSWYCKSGFSTLLL